MLVSQAVFATAVAITVVSGLLAVALVLSFHDRHAELGRRIVAARVAQIAVLGATEIFALLSPR